MISLRALIRGQAVVVMLVVVCALAGLGAIAAPDAHADALYPNRVVGAWDASTARFGNPSSTVHTPYLLKLSGWAADRDFPNSQVLLDIWVDGQPYLPIQTGLPTRPDVRRAVPWVGPSSGWQITLDANDIPGTTLCVYALDVPQGAGLNQLLGCKQLWQVGPKDPIGAFESVSASAGQIKVGGWAGDPDGTATTLMRVFYDDELEPVLEPVAALPRPDVRRALPRLSATTGFSLSLPINPGVHTICLVIQNSGPSGFNNIDLGCVHGTVPAARPPGPHDPRGGLDTMRGRDGLWNAVGWAYDPDTGGPVTVKVRMLGLKVDNGYTYPGRYLSRSAKVRTGVARPDVLAAVPAAGPNAGFDEIATASDGPLRVACAYAINVGPGVNRLLGCYTAPAP